ncbi:hypothetical protein [Novosphingobium sp.]|uniref:hypothetical protein n=1 Tax=Novosphingobium sp. TaxID=1874826 RepID=UPI0035654027
MEVNPDPFTGPVIYGLGITCGDALAAEIVVNDISFGKLAAGATSLESIPIHSDLDLGGNVAELLIGVSERSLSGPALPLPGKPPATANAKLQLEGDEVLISGEGLSVTTHTFARDIWDARTLAGPVMLPTALRVTFEPRAGSPVAPWARAQALSADDVEAAVYAETAIIAEMLRDRNFDAYVGATSLRRQHKARCYPNGPNAEVLREEELDDLLQLSKAKDFAVRIAAQVGSRLRAQAKSRLFDFVDTQGEPIVTIHANGQSFAVQHQFSFIDKGLQLVR